MLRIVMISVVMLSVILIAIVILLVAMQIVVMLNVVAPEEREFYLNLFQFIRKRQVGSLVTFPPPPFSLKIPLKKSPPPNKKKKSDGSKRL
jgi:hypothetical protein